LKQHAEQLWTFTVDHRFMGMPFGARMTIVRMPSGGLWIHSPVARSDEAVAAANELGPVEALVAPNLYHHLYAGEWKAAHPDATLWGAPGLAKKRKDLSLDGVLGPDPVTDWQPTLLHQPIAGTDPMQMSAFLHVPSRTLITADMMARFDEPMGLFSRGYFKMVGLWKRPALSRPLRMVFRDKAAARTCIDAVLDWDFDRVLFAHGVPIETDGQAAFRDAYAWLA
jgi:hypothetical protein